MIFILIVIQFILLKELKCDKDKIPKEATPLGYKAFWLSGDQGIETTLIRNFMLDLFFLISGLFWCWFINKNRSIGC